jgi:hypothetical protein
MVRGVLKKEVFKLLALVGLVWMKSQANTMLPECSNR